MDTFKFFYDNLWRQYTITATSEHENFPIEKTQHRDFNKQCRSQHGAGSGWGNFTIASAVNDRLDFEDNGTTTRVASLTPGDYTADELAAHIETQMEASGTADTFTVVYLELSNKFKITDDAGTFELLWNSGANKTRSIADTIGFDDSADDTGASNYTADELRIHSEERHTTDLLVSTDINAMIIRGHNFQSTATVEAIFSTDAWTTIAEAIAFTIQDKILVLQWDTPKEYRYVGYRIKDVDNPYLYVAVGVPYVGGQFQPDISFTSDGDVNRIDPSIIQASEFGQESSIQLDHFDVLSYSFYVNSLAQKDLFDAVFDEVGYSKSLFVCEDPDLPLSTTRYVAINGWRWTPIKRSIPLWTLSIEFREQR